MFQLLNEVKDPVQEQCDKYGVYSWSQYKQGLLLENPTLLQIIAQTYFFHIGIHGHIPRAVVLGKPLVERFVAEGIPIPETFEEAQITYDLEMPFRAGILG